MLLSGYIEVNPGPKFSFRECFLICYWNLNSISAQRCTKVSLLTGYNLIHNFDIIYVSETFQNSQTAPNDPNLVITGYNMYHTDHPANCQGRGICISTKQHFLNEY